MILVKNAKIIDGTGGPMRRGDVLVSGGSISAVGTFPGKKADIVIEALGMHLVPGFIAPHTHADHTLGIFTDPGQAEARAEGITTAIGGNDGLSLAPLMYGSLRSLRSWSGEGRINVGWHGMGEFAAAIGRMRLGINFATFAGYETIRRDVKGDGDGDMTDRETAVAMDIAKTAIEEGALGVSLDLDDAYGQKISHEEARLVARTVAEAGGILSLRMRRREEHFMEAAQEAVALYKSTGATIVVRDFVPPGLKKAEERDFMLAYETLRTAGDNLFVELFFGERRRLRIGDLLPRRARHDDPAAVHAALRDKKSRKEILGELPRCPDATILSVPREHRHLAGTTLESFAHARGLTLKEGVAELMGITRMQAVLALPHAPSQLNAELMKDSRTILSGSPRAIFAAADAARWPIERTVMRLTSAHAKAFGLRKRGVIAENRPADLALMNDRGEIPQTVVGGKAEGTGGIFLKAA